MEKGLFQITPHDGIVYVADPAGIDNTNVTYYLTVNWTYYNHRNGIARENSTRILIEIIPGGKCISEEDTQSCSFHKVKEECNCGFGASFGCTWRDSSNWENHTTTLFEMCSSNLATCPDGICDELEAMEERLCPIDCEGKFSYTIIWYSIS